MKPVVVSDVLAVGEFPTGEQIEILAKAGFKSILNNQPDGEVERFPRSAEIEGEARRLKLGYAFVPLSSRTPPADELQRYREAVAALPAPIYGFCYSGSRSAAACALLLAETTEVDQLVRDFADGGFDIESLRPWLEEARAKVTGGAAAEAAAGGAAPATNGHGAKASTASVGATENGSVKPAVRAEPAAVAPAAAKGALPRMIVVQPRAYGYGGFAM